MEAMACGLPVIASDIKGHRELVVHGVNGLMFESDNQAQMKDTLIHIYWQFNDSRFPYHSNHIKIFSLSEVKPLIIQIYLKTISTDK